MKPCIKCGELKELSEFYKHSAMSDGRLGKCKECCKKDNTANRRLKHDYYAAYDKQRANLPHRKKAVEEYHKNNPDKVKAIKDRWAKNNKDKIAASTSRYRSKYKHKAIAHGRTNYAVSAGKITKKPCALCGNEKVQAHHEDYNKPLEVIWLCPSCHAKLHKYKRANKMEATA